MNCKKGDLAIIVSDPNPDALGRLVEVLGAMEGYDDGMHYWRCKSLGGPIPYEAYWGNERLGFLESGPLVDIADHALRPIRSGEEPATTEREKALIEF